MTALQPMEAVTGRRKQRGDSDRPTDPVRKHSYNVDDPRAQPWRRIGIGTLPFGKAFVAAMNRTARWLYGEQHRQGYQGPDRLQRSHLLVLQGMLRRLDFATGRLDPSWATIAGDGSCGRSAVDRALEALHHAGFLCTVRRTVPRDGMEGQRGPQLKQTSSAVYFDCRRRMTPEVWARFWGIFREELRAGGKWLLSRARALLNAFNADAVPSPRERRVARAIKRATKAAVAEERAAPAQRPTLSSRGDQATHPTSGPDNRPSPAHEGLREALTRMAGRLGIDPAEVLNAST